MWILHLQCLSIQASHSSVAQQPHEASGYQCILADTSLDNLYLPFLALDSSDSKELASQQIPPQASSTPGKFLFPGASLQASFSFTSDQFHFLLFQHTPT